MAWAFRTRTTGQGTSTGFTATRPTGAGAGDAQVIVVRASSGSTNINTPAGWRKRSVGNQNHTFRRVGNPASDVDFTLGVSTQFVWIYVSAYDDGGLTPHFPDALEASASMSSTTSFVAPTLDAPRIGDLLWWAATAGAATTFTPPDGMTERADEADGARTVSIATETLAAAGETGTRTGTPATSTGGGAFSFIARIPSYTNLPLMGVG